MQKTKNITPAMRQFLTIKKAHPDEILFFRMGDFYEMFFDDAVLAARLLGITLTSRSKDKEIPMCGVPHHSAKAYIAKLVKDGYKVALCEQIEDPAIAKGPVKRAVTKVITPGVALDDDFLESGKNNFIAAVSTDKKKFALSYMDVLTGLFKVIQFGRLDLLIDELHRVGPKEVVVCAGGAFPPAGALDEMNFSFKKVSTLNKYDFSFEIASKRLMDKFNVISLDGFGCSGLTQGVRAAGALLHYVSKANRAELNHINRLVPYNLGNYLVLDYTSRRNLEITENLRTGEKTGSLLEAMDKTRTAMGARMIRSWLSYPLMDITLIGKRLCAVDALVEEKLTRLAIGEDLDSVYDLERLSGRVSLGAANPRDLFSLKLSLDKIPALKSKTSALSAPYLTQIALSMDDLPELRSIISAAINDNPPLGVGDGLVIKDGFNAQLDELRSVGAGAKDKLNAIETRERARTGVSTLKVGYNKVFGYYITVPRAKADCMPYEYIRKQTLVNAERYISPELKELESRILGAQDQIKVLETTLFAGIRQEVALFSDRIAETAKSVAVLDVLTGFADIAQRRNYIKPEVNNADSINIIEGRHPVVENSLGNDFVPNDILIDSTTDQVQIITGPNMAGKSTFMRQVALIVLMAQVGSFVPAQSAVIGVADRIFTRVGAADDIMRGQSTFMVEMSETANILNNATDRSLVILDEIGRGTSTFDGLSIAWAVAEYLHDTQGRRARTLFATHFHELTELSLTKERVKNYNVSVTEYEGEVIFLRKVRPGGSLRSYGLQVAQLAGLPSCVVARAYVLLKNLESGELDAVGVPRFITPTRAEPVSTAGAGEAQPSLPNVFSKGGGLLWEFLDGLELDSTSPIDALKALYKIKEIVDS